MGPVQGAGRGELSMKVALAGTSSGGRAPQRASAAPDKPREPGWGWQTEDPTADETNQVRNRKAPPSPRDHPPPRELLLPRPISAQKGEVSRSHASAESSSFLLPF